VTGGKGEEVSPGKIFMQSLMGGEGWDGVNGEADSCARVIVGIDPIAGLEKFHRGGVNRMALAGAPVLYVWGAGRRMLRHGGLR
jgi:hypothetical protein